MSWGCPGLLKSRSDLDVVFNRWELFSVVKSTTTSLNGYEFVETIHGVYDEIAQWRKNIFKLPSRHAAKMFI